MRTVVEIRFGSHLYGTATPQSDADFKSVFVPDARSILLGRVRESINTTTKAAGVLKNASGDVDMEAYSLLKFLSLCADGQTIALDMLFAPYDMLLSASGLWDCIQAERGRLLSRQVKGCLTYCRQQANKYGIKGSRVAAARATRDFFASAPPHAKLRDLAEARPFEDVFAGMEHVAVVDIDARRKTDDGPRLLRHLEVCNRKLPFNARAKEAHAVLDRLFAEYGHRALAAERNENVDWKALSHAVRVGRQAIELLETGAVRFPRPEAEHLVDIKLGRLSYSLVADEIEGLLEGVEAAAACSHLPEIPDRIWIEDLVADVYRAEIRSPADR